MAITLTEKLWKSTRPKSAKDSGVAGALAGTDKHCKKAVAAMTATEVEAAGKAADALDLALKTAQSGMASDASKEAKAAVPLIKGWRSECADYKKELTLRMYAIRVEIVTKVYKETFDNQKLIFDALYAKARLAHQGQAQPAEKDILIWMGGVRNMAKIATRSFIPNIPGLPEAKMVKPEDVSMPPGVKEVKPKLDELTAWCTNFAKAANRDARGAAAGAGDTSAVDKAVKSLMDDYTQVEGLMKQVIKAAEALAAEAKTLADRIKTEIGKGSKDGAMFKDFGADIKRLAKGYHDIDDDVRTINITWRESTGDMAKKNGALKIMAGYDEARHGAVLTQRTTSNMMVIRRATLPLSEASRQIDRARRQMQGSNDMRGYL
jgi:hypothetical protein